MKHFFYDWDKQGRVLLGREYCEPFGLKEDSAIVFQRISEKKFRIIPKEKLVGEISLRLEAKLDNKYRFFVPAILRKKYKNDFDLTYSTIDECFYITFAEFAE